MGKRGKSTRLVVSSEPLTCYPLVTRCYTAVTSGYTTATFCYTVTIAFLRHLAELLVWLLVTMVATLLTVITPPELLVTMVTPLGNLLTMETPLQRKQLTEKVSELEKLASENVNKYQKEVDHYKTQLVDQMDEISKLKAKAKVVYWVTISLKSWEQLY